MAPRMLQPTNHVLPPDEVDLVARHGDVHGLTDFLQMYVGPLREQLYETIARLPSRPGNAGELARLLGINRAQVWRIWEAAHADDLATVAIQLCGESGMDRFLTEMMKNGLSAEQADAVRARHATLEQAVRDEIGDQTIFKMMLSGSPGEANADPRFTRSQFDAARWRFGVQADAVLSMSVRTPSQFPGLIDSVVVMHYERLRTLRRIKYHLLTQLTYNKVVALNSDALKPSVFTVAPFKAARPGDAEIPNGGTPVELLPGVGDPNGRAVWRFCADGHMWHVVFSGGKNGRIGESSFCFGFTMPAVDAFYDRAEGWATSRVPYVPAEEYILECFVSDEEVRSGLVLRPQVHELLLQQKDLMSKFGHFGNDPRGHRVEHYAPQIGRPNVEAVPEYAQIVDAVESELQISLKTYHLFRWRLRLPAVGMRYLMIAGKER